jgi:hypothetical protein
MPNNMQLTIRQNEIRKNYIITKLLNGMSYK